MRKFKKKYWTNLAWIKDGCREVYLYDKKEDALAVSDNELANEVKRVEVREL